MQITNRPDQNTIDMVVTATGSLESLFALAIANGISITGDVAAGTVLTLPDSAIVDANALSYLQQNNIVIATGQTPGRRGIGIMTIGSDLIVG